MPHLGRVACHAERPTESAGCRGERLRRPANETRFNSPPGIVLGRESDRQCASHFPCPFARPVFVDRMVNLPVMWRFGRCLRMSNAGSRRAQSSKSLAQHRLSQRIGSRGGCGALPEHRPSDPAPERTNRTGPVVGSRNVALPYPRRMSCRGGRRQGKNGTNEETSSSSCGEPTSWGELPCRWQFHGPFGWASW